MPQLLRLPEIAANTTEAVLASWPIAENTLYSAADVIATVETDKAVVDVEADSDGVILRRLVAEGTEVAVGEPIALIGAPGEAVDDIDAALDALGGHPAADRVFASPLARRIAREARLDIDHLDGTGPNGRILRRDVERVLSAEAPPETPPQTNPHTRMRRAIAERLSDSAATVPHFYLRGTARVDALQRLRAELNDDDPPVRISVNDLVVKAVARAHVLVPAMNVVWTPEAVRSFDTVDIGVAVATPRGLVTPVVRDADRAGITSIAATVRDLAERAEAGTLQQRELEGGTTTVSNLGMFGTEEFAAIINPPQSSILAVGAVRSEPVADDGRLAVGEVMRVTLSVDHRPVDGVVAAQWMRAFLSLLEHPVRILA
jgi:pyruvate dehydrogenase E2 component (dihydrolipoamide acetyltransferase)